MHSGLAAPSRLRPWSVIAVVLAASCLPQPGAPANEATFTQVPVGTVVPGSGPSGTTTNAIVAGGMGINANGTAPAVPSLAGLKAKLSLASSAAPDLCLSVADSPSPQSALVLRQCAEDALQRWIYVNGVLQSSQGNCITYDPATSAAGLAPCDSNNTNQQLLSVGGQLSVRTATASMTLKVAALPVTTASVINFGSFDPNMTSQQAWNMGQYSHDSNQALITHGVSIQMLESGSTCLSGVGSAPIYAPCVAADTNQAWTIAANGLIQNEGTNQCLGINGSAAQMVPCQKGPTSFWGVQSGVLYNANSMCLDQDASAATPALLPCDFTKSRHFIFGLSKN